MPNQLRTAKDYTSMQAGTEHAWEPCHAGDQATVRARTRAIDEGRLRVIGREDRPKSLEQLEREEAEAAQDRKNREAKVAQGEERARRAASRSEAMRRAQGDRPEILPILDEAARPFGEAAVGERTVSYAELAQRAFERSGMDALEWNALPAQARVLRVEQLLDLLRLELAKARSANPSAPPEGLDPRTIGQPGPSDDAPVPQGEPVAHAVTQAPADHPNAILGTELLGGQAELRLDSGAVIGSAELVGLAFSHSGLSREEWNALPNTNRAAMLSFESARQSRIRNPSPTADSPEDQAAEADAAKGLLGSSTLPAGIRVGEHEFALGDIVAGAHKRSGLSAREWNELPDSTREVVLALEIQRLGKRAAEAQPPA